MIHATSETCGAAFSTEGSEASHQFLGQLFSVLWLALATLSLGASNGFLVSSLMLLPSFLKRDAIRFRASCTSVGTFSFTQSSLLWMLRGCFVRNTSRIVWGSAPSNATLYVDMNSGNKCSTSFARITSATSSSVAGP